MLLVTIWPIFALICLGFVLARADFPGAAFWPAADRVNYFVLFPALLVVSLAAAPMGDPALLRLGAAAAAMIALATLAMALLRRARPSPGARFGPALQGLVRFNTYLGLALAAALLGTEGTQRAAIFLAVAVPLVNVVSIVALTERAQRRGVLAMARLVLGNPLILACLLGIALAVTGAGLPHGTGRFLDLLGQASLPLGLLCVGAALRPAALGRDIPAVAGVTLLRLLAMPLLAAGIARLFALGEAETLVLVIFAAIPTAATSYVLTRQLGGDSGYMAALVTTQTLASIATIPLVLGVLG